MAKALPNLLLGALFCVSLPSLGQDIGSDSKGGSVFTVYALKAVRAEINTKEPLAISHVSILDSLQKIRVGSEEPTVGKVSGLTTRLAISNSGKNIILSNLLSTKLGLEGRAGYQLVVDSVTNLKGFKGTYSFGIGAIAGFDNFMYYNKNNNSVSHERPINIGIEGNYNFYFTPHAGTKRPYPTRWVFAFNASITRTWNSDDLISYQYLDKATLTQRAVALEKFEGRYGDLNKKFWKGKASLAFPVYIGHLNVIPYYSTIITSTKFTSTPGVNVNYVVSPLEWYKYKFPTTLGFGVDWFDKEVKKPNLFIRGTFTLPHK